MRTYSFMEGASAGAKYSAALELQQLRAATTVTGCQRRTKLVNTKMGTNVQQGGTAANVNHSSKQD